MSYVVLILSVDLLYLSVESLKSFCIHSVSLLYASDLFCLMGVDLRKVF